MAPTVPGPPFSPLDAALDVSGLCDVVVPGIVLVGELLVELLCDIVAVEFVVVDVNVGVGKDKGVVLLATLQNCWARDSVVASSWGHPAAIQLTISSVKCLLRGRF